MRSVYIKSYRCSGEFERFHLRYIYVIIYARRLGINSLNQRFLAKIVYIASKASFFFNCNYQFIIYHSYYINIY